MNGAAPRPGPTVLVVDDDPSIRELLRRILEAAGYTVVVAPDAVTALAAMVEHAPEVAFLDVHMPGENGLWLADQIRNRFPTAATVLATADSNLSPIENVRHGIIGYLVKPFLHADVIRAVEDGVAWARALRDMQH